MYVMRVARVLILQFVLAAGTSALAEPGASPSAGGDRGRLGGRWIERSADLELNVLFDVDDGVAIAASGTAEGGGGFARTAVGRLAGYGEDDRGRYFDLEPRVAASAGLPGRVYYGFDGDDLVLDVAEGPMRGRHVLSRDDGAVPRAVSPGVRWAVAAAGLAAVLLFGAASVIRLRRKPAA